MTDANTLADAGANDDESMARGFVYQANPARVIFGVGALARIDAELARLGVERALVLSTPNQRPLAERVAALIGARSAGIFSGAAMHVPVDTMRAGCDAARAADATGVVAIGGGSTLGLAKAIALDTGLPIAAIPTTYAGSEMTPIYGITDGGRKTTGRDDVVLPRVVLYDPELTLALPLPVSVSSGLNAIAHAAEGLYAQDANPVTSLLAEEGMRGLARGLVALRANPSDLNARASCLYGAWLCGTVLGTVGMALHHKLCHTLGGTFNLPHAETHAIVLPHAIAYNAPAAPEAVARIARALGVDDAAQGLHALARTLGVPASLREIGLREADLDLAADVAMQSPYYNPRPVTRDGIRQLLDDAFHDRPPRAE
jgi:maleylacetate reductase